MKNVNCPRCGKVGQLQPVDDGKKYYELICSCSPFGSALLVATEQLDKYPDASKENVLGDSIKKGNKS